MEKLYSLSRYFILVIILSHFSSNSPAQSNKFTGFYINTQGDTIRGSFPRYIQWNHNPDSITFIPIQSRNHEILTPSFCAEFHIDGYETYIAFHGKRMINPMIFSRSDTKDDADRYDTITTFLREFAITETHTFYIYKDKNRFNLYYSTNEGVIEELLQKVYVVDNSSIQSMTYKEQLQTLFPEKTGEIGRLLYTEESLAAFLGKQKKAIIPVKKGQREYGGFYISGGVSLNSLKFSPNVSMEFSEKNYESRQVPLVAIGYIVPFNRNFSRVFFLPQIKISSLKHTAKTLYHNAYPVNSTTFQSSPVISLGFNFGYNIINHPDLKVSLAPGAGLNFLMKFKHIETYEFNATNSTTVVTAMDHLKPIVDLQATVIIKNRYVIWSAYNFPTHITIYPATKDKFSSKQLGVGYKFK
ncbi:MAG: hypothetical protein ABIN89_31305 [Chitinophagaceae bacterium]